MRLPRCGAMKSWRSSVLECDRKTTHRGKHRSLWREGNGSSWFEVIVWWKS